MRQSISRLLIGEPLASEALKEQTIGRAVGLAVFASDALSSVAYATEEILVILALAAGASWVGSGGAIFSLSMPIALAIAMLLVIVTLSYRQTIYTYPNGGGAYIVARDNLGEVPAQVAGAALITDYILTVAVSVSSGVAQIVSAFPIFHNYRVHLAILVVLGITVLNLRGVKESGRIFAVPTYFFIASMFLMLGVGVIRYLSGSLPTVVNVQPIEHSVLQPLTLFLVLRAFSSGSTALTGIEAISNGVTAFKEPRSRNAAATLVWLTSIAIIFFVGTTFLANQVQALPSERETVISQLARTIYGENVLYLLTLAGTTLILLMAANTSYNGLPRLAALQASDGFLPRQLTYRGSRLVFSQGIMFLAIAAIVLISLMGAKVTALIPLYAIGVFLSFTLSQTGMVVRMRKIGRLRPGEVQSGMETELTYDPRWRVKMAISAVGAVCTFIVMIIFTVTKFSSGAWMIVVTIPLLVILFFRIHHHYQEVARTLRLRDVHLDDTVRPVQTLVLIADVHAETLNLINFARALGHPWQAVHVAVNEERTRRVLEKWAQYVPDRELKVLRSPYRQLVPPIEEMIRQIQREHPGCFVHIVMGQLMMDTFWEQALHQNSSFIFNLALSRLEKVAVTVVPYQIHHQSQDG